MPDFTVLEIGEDIQEWEDSYGNDNVTYDLTVRDESSGEVIEVQHNRRASSPEPEVDEVMDAYLEDDSDGQYAPKLKRVYKEGAGGGKRRKRGAASGKQSSGQQKRAGGGSKAKGGRKDFDPDDPYWKSQNAMKGRSAAQERAVGFVAAKVAARGIGDAPGGLLDERNAAALTKQLTLDGLRNLIDWFADDVERAGKRGSAAPTSSDVPEPELPADTSGMGDPGPEEGPAPSDDDLPF